MPELPDILAYEQALRARIAGRRLLALSEHVTAFRPDMAVHGKYGRPCPVCGTPVQRIVYAQNEANYCVVCQTGGRLLADRSLSRLLRDDWPRTLEELEERKHTAREAVAKNGRTPQS
ncbi:MAG: zinc finger domain-containing protein [Vicinamibacterales bacterium]